MSIANLSDYNALLAYVQNLATNHREVLHDANANPAFFVIDDSKLERATHAGAPVVLLMEYDDGQIASNRADNHIDRLTVAISAMQPVTDSMDDIAIAQARREMKRILLEFWARIQRDQRQGHIERVDLETFQYQFIGPALGQRYGCRVEFEVVDSISVQYQPGQWNDE